MAGLREAITRLFADKTNFNYSEGNEEKIAELVEKGKSVTVKPTSSRYYTRGAEGNYRSGEPSMDPYSGGARVGKPSTAISKVEYNPKTQICKVTYRGGNKAYSYRMTPKEFETFMTAPSKGRHASKVMKFHNRIDNWR